MKKKNYGNTILCYSISKGESMVNEAHCMVDNAALETTDYKIKILVSCVGTLIMREAQDHETIQTIVSFLACPQK